MQPIRRRLVLQLVLFMFAAQSSRYNFLSKLTIPLTTGFAAAAAMSSSSSSTPAASCSNQPAALIFLHGLGDTPAGWSSLEYTLPSIQKSLGSKNMKYIFPHAPTIGITINGGATMPGWFDIYDWPIAVGTKDDPKGVMKAVQQIEKEVEKLKTDHGISRDRIVLGGFSQGGAIAMIAAYYKKKNGGDSDETPYAGCIALSGWLTLVKEFETKKMELSSEALQKTPLLWGHGQYDDKVLFEQQAFGLQKFDEWASNMDVSPKIEHYQYPMGHQSVQEEIEHTASFLNKVLFEEKK